MGEIKKQTLSGVKWTAIERFSIQGVQFILGIVIARFLTPADYGLIGMISIFFAISQTLIDSGISTALVRKLDRNDVDFSTAFYFNIVVATICAAILYIIAPWIAEFFNQPLLSPIAKISSINLIIGAFGAIQYTQLTIAINFKTPAKINFIAAVISGVICLILAFIGFGVWALVWQTIIANLLKTIMLWIISRWRPKFIFSKSSFRGMFGYGNKLLISGLINTIYSEMTTIVIGKFYTPASLGNYTRGQSMASLPVGIISDMFNRVTFPIFAKIQEDQDKLIRVYRDYISLIMMAVVFIVLLLVSLAKPIIVLLLTEKWAGAIIFLQVYAFAVLIDPICYLNVNLLKVVGRTDLVLKLEIIKKSIATGILFAAVPFGVLAICISKVIYGQIAVILNTYYTGKLFSLGYWTQIKDFLPYMLYSAIACVPAIILAYTCPWNLVSIVIGGILAVLLYIIILTKLNDKIYMTYVYQYISAIGSKLCNFKSKNR